VKYRINLVLNTVSYYTTLNLSANHAITHTNALKSDREHPNETQNTRESED